MTTAAGFLGGQRDGDAAWRFAIGRELHGAFGGAFGGAVAAATIVAARPLAPGRTPASLDCRFLRGLPAGTARAVPTVVHEGRTLSCVSIDVVDERDKLSARATVSLVAPEALRPLDHEGAETTPSSWTPYDEAKPWQPPPGVEAPIVTMLAPRFVGSDDRGIASAVRVPWDEPGASAEAVCLAADLCVGPPVGGAFPGQWYPHPNPDLALRFAGEVTGDVVVGAGRLERIAGGVAAVRIEVWAAGSLVAVGAATSLLVQS